MWRVVVSWLIIAQKEKKKKQIQQTIVRKLNEKKGGKNEKNVKKIVFVVFLRSLNNCGDRDDVTMFYPVVNGGSMTTLQSEEERSHYMQSVFLKLNKNLLTMFVTNLGIKTLMKITRVCKSSAIKLVNSCMNKLKAYVFKKH